MKNRQYFEIHQARYDFILHKISRLAGAGASVLDVGCYPMHVFEEMRKRGYKVEGIASEFEKVEGIKSLNIEKNKWPFASNSFDLVLMTEIVEHLVGNPMVYLKEAKRVLKRGGKILVTTPNVIRLQNLVMLLMEKNIYFPMGQLRQNIYFRHNREYAKKELESILREAGFETEAGFFIGYPPNREKNKSDNLGLKVIKWINYLIQRVWVKRQDSLWAIGYSK